MVTRTHALSIQVFKTGVKLPDELLVRVHEFNYTLRAGHGHTPCRQARILIYKPSQK
jgi:hypothetical protein